MLDSLSRALTQKMLHGAMAELHSAPVDSRDAVAASVRKMFLRS